MNNLRDPSGILFSWQKGESKHGINAGGKHLCYSWQPYVRGEPKKGAKWIAVIDPGMADEFKRNAEIEVVQMKIKQDQKRVKELQEKAV